MNSTVSWDAAPRCSFHVRTEVHADPPAYRYSQVHVPSGAGDIGVLRMPTPPVVGDLIWLVDESGEHTGTHRILERSWMPSLPGSADWPTGSAHPRVGPVLVLIIEPARGPFRDEVDLEKEEMSTR
ncbi:hypothetical protein [Streptomyces filamentosus]|uniref:hypothetical protein n=1 Tax=Streptomyces filamentosus TaxID=67294 RepID=UPI0033D472F9